ncbi:hypothetical protein DPMN_036088 [Dreissena polymorpha]|uniref:Uncharacterized protein n=1 Tax=Dreissena polymorpha TaxID=45954 RepID=A0A9D4RNK1_DREPO|nr:hypothetical protein DPMN_036088 [Dreissena polymorpha]
MEQRRAARYVTNRYHNTSSVSSMIEHLQWETLESRRTKAQHTMLYKIINDLVDIPANQYLVQAPSRQVPPAVYIHILPQELILSTNHIRLEPPPFVSRRGPLTLYPSSRGFPHSLSNHC